MAETVKTALAERVKLRMDALGLNPFATAKLADLKPGYVHDILRGKVRSPSAKYMRALARALETSSAFLLGEEERPVEVRDQEGNLVQVNLAPNMGRDFHHLGGAAKRLPVKHELAAMVWRNATEVSGKPIGYEIASVPLELESRENWLELVRDDSMSSVIPKGSLVHVVEVKGHEVDEICEGDIVVLVKHLFIEDGAMHLVERSLRRIRHTLPEQGLWFYELASGDPEMDWTDELFRDEHRPVHAEDNIESGALEAATPGMETEDRDRFIEFIKTHRERRPRVVGKVIRALVPLHPAGGFGFTLS